MSADDNDILPRVVRLETELENVTKTLGKREHESDRNRTSIHKLRGDCHDLFNIQRESMGELRDMIGENAMQIKLTNEHVLNLADNQKEMKEAVDNNTEVMSQLKGGLKVFVWLVGSLGAILTVVKLVEII